MGIVKAGDVARAALNLLTMPRIPYVINSADPKKGMDCQGLVQYCVRKAGGVSRYLGSNDMFRHDSAWVGTIEQAKAQGKLVPGAAVYVVSPSGSYNQPKKYVADGIGNAHHVGVYCGEPNAECVSASSVKGYVGVTTLAQSWTHVAWLKDVDYSGGASVAASADNSQTTEQPPTADTQADNSQATTTAPTANPKIPYDALVKTPTGNKLNLRKAPSTTTGARLAQVPPGTPLKVLSDDQSGWIQVEYNGQQAWAQKQYVVAAEK
ncbi:MAG: SH3 domain-containing protein [Oscillospiraceae bacterium]|jgi:hypothetical protein|nr:SH3 domain-containing protein [Oscillospiraceae bacterium]